MAPVLSQRSVGASQEIPKSANNHQSYTIFEVVVTVLEVLPLYWNEIQLLLLGLPCNRRRAKKEVIACDGTTIRWVSNHDSHVVILYYHLTSDWISGRR
jgi:hypothetical protein